MKTKKNIFFFVLSVMVMAFLNVNASNPNAGEMRSSSSSSSSSSGGDGKGRFSIGGELAIPTGTLGDQSSLGYGLSLRYEVPTGDNFGFTATLGYVTFGSKSIIGYGGYGTTYKYTNSMIPIQVGMKYYFQEQQDGFYLHVQLGVTMFTSSYEYTELPYTFFGNYYPGNSSSDSQTKSHLSYSPGLGYHLSNFDFCFHYQIISTSGSSSSYQGIRMAYVFGSN